MVIRYKIFISTKKIHIHVIHTGKNVNDGPYRENYAFYQHVLSVQDQKLLLSNPKT